MRTPALSPEGVVEMAFTAAAAGDSQRVLELFDIESLQALLRARIQLLRSMQTSGMERGSVGMYQHLLQLFNVSSLDELERVEPPAMLEAVLRARRDTFSRLRCHPFDSVRESSDQAYVRFKLQWLPESAPRAIVRTAHLRRTDRWQLTTTPLNEWLLPGLDGELIPDIHSGL